jgi:hypothetical protein
MGPMTPPAAMVATPRSQPQNGHASSVTKGSRPAPVGSPQAGSTLADPPTADPGAKFTLDDELEEAHLD